MDSEKKKILCAVTDYVEENLNWEEEQFAGTSIAYRHHQLRGAPAEELLNEVKDADILVVDQAHITAEVLRGLSECRLIIRHGDGYDNLDLNAATRAGIVCINEPGFWSREAAEQAFVLGLSLALRIPLQQSVASSPHMGTDAGWNLKRIMPYGSLGSLTVGLVGFGKTGTEAARLWKPVASRVLACDPYMEEGRIRELGAEPASFDDLIARSDLVSIHIPAAKDTKGMFNRNLLGRMKKGALLVNTARGSLVDTEALTEALKNGHLAGAALDSTDPEPLPGGHPLFFTDNVIITPHMGWYSEDALGRMRKAIVSDILDAAEGRLPDSIINPEVLKSPRLRWPPL